MDPAAEPSVIPYLLYQDAAAALTWLEAAFGFEVTLRHADGDGVVHHAEMRVGNGVVMLGQPEGGFRNPKHTGDVSQMVVVNVNNVDERFARAKAAGADVISEPEDKPYGDRMCALGDPEGHRWYFSQHIRDVSPKEWGAVTV